MNMIHLSRAEYNTLSTIGTLTKGGVTYTFDPINNEYIVPTTTKYQHNIYLAKFDTSNSKVLVGSFQLINTSPTAVSDLASLITTLTDFAPNTNDRVPCHLVYQSTVGKIDYVVPVLGRASGTNQFSFSNYSQTLIFTANNSLYYGGSEWTTGGAIQIVDNVIEL